MRMRTHGRAALVAAMALVSTAHSTESRRYFVDLPSLPLWPATRHIERAVGVRVFLDSDIPPNAAQLHAVYGKFTPEEMLERALAGTSLWFRLVPKAGYEICRPSRPTCPSPQSVPEVLVRGGGSRNTDSRRTRDAIRPSVVIDRQQIERTNVHSYEELFPALLPFANLSTFAGVQSLITGEAQQLDLRAMGAGQSAVLLDGRKIAGRTMGGDAMQSLLAIPIDAIDRIEVHPTTSSSQFGTRVTAGGANIILRAVEPGIRLSATADTVPGTPAGARRVFGEVATKLREGRGTFSMWFGYSYESMLLTRDRDLSSSARARIAANNPDSPQTLSAPPLSAQTNVLSVTGESLIPGHDVVRLYIPPGWKETDGLESLLPNAGEYSPSLAPTAQLGGAFSAIRPRSETQSGNASLHYELTSRVSVDAQLGCARIKRSAAGSGADFVNYRRVRLEANTPTNPFPVAVWVTAPLAVGDAETRSDYQICRGIAALQWQFAEKWAARFEYNPSRTDFTLERPVLNVPPSAIADGAVNVLRDPVDEASFRPALSTLELPAINSNMSHLSLLLAGPTLRLPAGLARLTFLLEQSDERLVDDPVASLLFINALGASQTRAVIPEQGERVRSAYSELNLPLRTGEYPRAEAQLTARFDDYRVDTARADPDVPPMSGFDYSTSRFSAFSWTTALLFQPIEGLSFRGSYGTGFMAPSAIDLSVPIEQQIDSPLIVDPTRPAAPIGPFTLRLGGNPDLKPELSRDYTAGVVIEPSNTLRLGVDFTVIKKQRGFYSPSGDFFPNTAEYIRGNPRRISRDPVTGRITLIDVTRVNALETEMRAFDIAFDYAPAPMRFGALSFSSLVSIEPVLATQLTEMSPKINVAGNGTRGPAKTRAYASLTWVEGPWAAGWSGRFTSRYRVSYFKPIQDDQGDEFVHSQTYHDVWASYAFPEGILGTKSLQVQIGATNVTQKRPPLDAGDPNLVSRYGWGEVPTLYLTLRLTPK